VEDSFIAGKKLHLTYLTTKRGTHKHGKPSTLGIVPTFRHKIDKASVGMVVYSAAFS